VVAEENGQVEVAVLAKDEGVVALQAVELDPGAGETTQPPGESEQWTPDDTIQPPEDMIAFKRLTETSEPRATSIASLVRNTVGLGWDITPWPYRERVDDEVVKEAREQLDLLARRDVVMGRPSFSDLMEAVKWDQKEVGNGYLEVSRNRLTGKVDGLYHVPGEKIRRKRERDGWVMGQNATLIPNDPYRVDYFNFGEKVAYDKGGTPQRKLSDGARGKGGWKRNELIPFREYSSASRDYGVPRDASLAVEYLASRFVEEWTAGYFHGSGVPPTLIFVQGEEQKQGNRIRFTVPQSTMNRIGQSLNANAKPGARVAVIPVPPGTKIDSVGLAELSERDITFGDFKTMHRRNVGSAFGLMPIFYGDVESGGRYTAEVQRSLTLEQTFDPDQRQTEDRLWTTLMCDLGYHDLRIKFKRLAVEGDAVRRESAVNMAEVGAITMGEYRSANGYGPLDEDEYGEGFNARLVNAGPPPGAENRIPVDAASGAGLRPGLAGRVPSERHDERRRRAFTPPTVTKADHGDPAAEEEVDALESEVAEAVPK
jgi:capsid portal protein